MINNHTHNVIQNTKGLGTTILQYNIIAILEVSLKDNINFDLTIYCHKKNILGHRRLIWTEKRDRNFNFGTKGLFVVI